MSKLIESEILKRAKKIHGNKYDYSEIKYLNIKEKVKIYCNKCKKYFWQSFDHHLRGSGCPFCIGNKRLTSHEFIQKAKEIHGNKYEYSQVEYINNNTKIKIFCNNCKKYFLQTPAHHLIGIKNCPYCRDSILKKENIIANKLNQYNINFIRQKRFEDCKDKHLLPFDFYLPDYNLCIEYQGEQHFIFKKLRFRYSTLQKAKVAFILQQKHDQIKKKYCNQNNIHLFEITYKDNLEEKLNNLVNIILKNKK